MNTLTKPDQLTTDDKRELRESLSGIMAHCEGIAAECKRYVAVLDLKRAATLAFMRENGVSQHLLDAVELVGRGKKNPLLLLDTSIGAEMLGRVDSVEEQGRLLKVGVNVAYLDGGEIKVKVKPISELTKSEAPLALCRTGNRPVEEQQVMLKQSFYNQNVRLMPYELQGDILVVRTPVRLEFSVIEEICEKMRKAHDEKKKTLEAVIKHRQISK